MERLMAHIPANASIRARFRGTLTDEHGWIHALLNIAAQAHAVALVGRSDLPLQAGFRCVSDRSMTHAAFAGVVGLP